MPKPQSTHPVESLLWKNAVVLHELAPFPWYPVISLSVDDIEEGLNLPSLISCQRHVRIHLNTIGFGHHAMSGLVIGLPRATKFLNDVVPSTHVNLGTTRELKYESAVASHGLKWEYRKSYLYINGQWIR